MGLWGALMVEFIFMLRMFANSCTTFAGASSQQLVGHHNSNKAFA
jgi:hypothetical protein